MALASRFREQHGLLFPFRRPVGAPREREPFWCGSRAGSPESSARRMAIPSPWLPAQSCARGRSPRPAPCGPALIRGRCSGAAVGRSALETADPVPHELHSRPVRHRPADLRHHRRRLGGGNAVGEDGVVGIARHHVVEESAGRFAHRHGRLADTEARPVGFGALSPMSRPAGFLVTWSRTCARGTTWAPSP